MAKVTHNCQEKPEEVCEKKFCGRDQKEGSDYCPAHTQQVWIRDTPKKETTEREIPIFDITIYYTAEVHAKVSAPTEHQAYQKVRENPDLEPEITDEVHKTAREIGTDTEIEEHGFKDEPPTYLRLDSMQPETIGDRGDSDR
jgi:hypothetical protein